MDVYAFFPMRFEIILWPYILFLTMLFVGLHERGGI